MPERVWGGTYLPVTSCLLWARGPFSASGMVPSVLPSSGRMGVATGASPELLWGLGLSPLPLWDPGF